MTDINKDLEDNFNQAENLRSTGDYDGAIKLLLNILEKKENLLPVLNSAANCYFQLNNFDLAEKYYLKCLKIDPENRTLLNNISLLYIKTKNFKKALSALELSLEKDYNQENIVEKIAYCLTCLNSFNELNEFCKKYLTIYPNNKTILSYYRRNLFKIGEYEKALEAYQKETGVIEFNDDKIKID